MSGANLAGTQPCPGAWFSSVFPCDADSCKIVWVRSLYPFAERPMEVVLRVTSGPHRGSRRVCEGQGSFLVGRSSHVSFSMPDDRLLSREHFLVEVNPPLCDLTDLGSTNGQR